MTEVIGIMAIHVPIDRPLGKWCYINRYEKKGFTRYYWSDLMDVTEKNRTEFLPLVETKMEMMTSVILIQNPKLSVQYI